MNKSTRLTLLSAAGLALAGITTLMACQTRYDHVSHPIPYDVAKDAKDDAPEATAGAERFISPAIQSPLSFILTDNAGKPYPLKQHLGQVVLIVNTASQCGLTPQYAGMEEVYKKYKGQGFTVIAVPANNFNGQEPGTDGEIRAFCTDKYHTTFPLMAKASVKGADICPLYQFLTSTTAHKDAHETNLSLKGDIEWNFAKFLVDRNGKVIARFKPNVDPRKPEVVAAIEKALAEKPISAK